MRTPAKNTKAKKQLWEGRTLMRSWLGMHGLIILYILCVIVFRDSIGMFISVHNGADPDLFDSGRRYIPIWTEAFFPLFAFIIGHAFILVFYLRQWRKVLGLLLLSATLWLPYALAICSYTGYSFQYGASLATNWGLRFSSIWLVPLAGVLLTRRLQGKKPIA